MARVGLKAALASLPSVSAALEQLDENSPWHRKEWNWGQRSVVASIYHNVVVQPQLPQLRKGRNSLGDGELPVHEVKMPDPTTRPWQPGNYVAWDYTFHGSSIFSYDVLAWCRCYGITKLKCPNHPNCTGTLNSAGWVYPLMTVPQDNGTFSHLAFKNLKCTACGTLRCSTLRCKPPLGGAGQGAWAACAISGACKTPPVSPPTHPF